MITFSYAIAFVFLLHFQHSLAGPTICKKVVDIALVIDESGSIGPTNFERIKGFIKDTVSRFSVSQYGTHFGLVKYSTNAQIVFSLNQYTDITSLQNSIKAIPFGGGSTYTGKALKMAGSQLFGTTGDRVNVPDVLVIFSDGESNDHSTAVKFANDMKNKDVKILVVAMGNGLALAKLIVQLEQLVSEKRYVFKTAMDALDTIRDDLVKEMCEAAGCSAAKFNKQGCFKTPPSKPKETFLFSNRSNIEWGENWDKFIDDVVCGCGAAAKKKGYKYFFIEFYSECWGSNTILLTGEQAGPKKCWGKRPNYDQCNNNEEKPICVGTANHGYVYELH